MCGCLCLQGNEPAFRVSMFFARLFLSSQHSRTTLSVILIVVSAVDLTLVLDFDSVSTGAFPRPRIGAGVADGQNQRPPGGTAGGAGLCQRQRAEVVQKAREHAGGFAE